MFPAAAKHWKSEINDVVACLASPIAVELCRMSINEVNIFLSRFAPPSRFAPHYAIYVLKIS